MSNLDLLLDEAPRRVPGVRFRRVGKRLMLIVGNRVFELNDTAEIVWNSIDGTNTVGAISDKVAEEYDEDRAVIGKHVAELLAELLELQAVEL